MDPQPTTPPQHSHSSPSHLLIKLTNPYTSTQQPEAQTELHSPKPSSPLAMPLKTPSIKKEELSKDDSLDESGSNEETSNLEDSGQKSGGKRVYTKRTTDKIRRWTKEESKLYEDFIDMYSDIFNDSSSKRVTKIFIFMANYIGTKTPSQCRSHHQKFFRRIQREKLISSGKVTNEEELERLMPKKRKKKSEKAKETAQLEALQTKEPSLPAKNGSNTKIENGAVAENETVKTEPNGEGTTGETTTQNGGNGYYPEEAENGNEIPQGQQPLNFIENEGYGKMEAPAGFMSLKRNYEAFRKLSVDDKEWMTLFNNKTRRKSSISMLFNNNYYYQTDPELSNNLDLMHKAPNFLDDQLGNNYPPPQIVPPNNGMYPNYPPPQYYYNGYPSIFPNGVPFGYNPPYESNPPPHNEESTVNNNEEKGSAMLKQASKPVIENQQILWNNAMDNVDVIDQYLKSMEKS